MQEIRQSKLKCKHQHLMWHYVLFQLLVSLSEVWFFVFKFLWRKAWALIFETWHLSSLCSLLLWILLLKPFWTSSEFLAEIWIWIFVKCIFTNAWTICFELVNCFIEVLTNSIPLLTFANQATGHQHQATVNSFLWTPDFVEVVPIKNSAVCVFKSPMKWI